MTQVLDHVRRLTDTKLPVQSCRKFATLALRILPTTRSRCNVTGEYILFLAIQRGTKMGAHRRFWIAVFTFLASALFAQSAGAVVVTGLIDPTVLNPGATVNPLPNGYSGSSFIDNFFKAVPFSFTDGLSGTLNEYVNQFNSTGDPAHPYGSDLHFAFEIQLTSGTLSSFSAPGYGGFDVSVKQCAISGCSGFASNGDVVATSASRSSDGNYVTFFFDPTQMDGKAHSGNLQIFTNSTFFVDPTATFTDSNGETFSISVPAPAVPEASTWAMLLIGFAGIGFMACRLKAKPALIAA
jgi:hypothetical protein